jgi:two-component system cell cycle sensor histidine kinase/response regulator CckA
MAYGIVKQYGGDIWVSSELGRGTAFKIYFPRIGADDGSSKPAQSGALPGGGN